MSENTKVPSEAVENKEQYSLNDDRRVKVLSPGQLVAKRFFRNRLAVTGLVILLAMFVFSFIGGLVTPYAEDQKFYRSDTQVKDYAAVGFNEEFRYIVDDKENFGGAVQAQSLFNFMKGAKEFE